MSSEFPRRTESSQGRKNGSTLAPKGRLEEFDGPSDGKKFKFLVCEPSNKGWPCCPLSWLKDALEKTWTVAVEWVNPGAWKREARKTNSQKRSRGGGRLGVGEIEEVLDLGSKKKKSHRVPPLLPQKGSRTLSVIQEPSDLGSWLQKDLLFIYFFTLEKELGNWSCWSVEMRTLKKFGGLRCWERKQIHG